jgi:hypothetical protein
MAKIKRTLTSYTQHSSNSRHASIILSAKECLAPPAAAVAAAGRTALEKPDSSQGDLSADILVPPSSF